MYICFPLLKAMNANPDGVVPGSRGGKKPKAPTTAAAVAVTAPAAPGQPGPGLPDPNAEVLKEKSPITRASELLTSTEKKIGEANRLAMVIKQNNLSDTMPDNLTAFAHEMEVAYGELDRLVQSGANTEEDYKVVVEHVKQWFNYYSTQSSVAKQLENGLKKKRKLETAGEPAVFK